MENILVVVIRAIALAFNVSSELAIYFINHSLVTVLAVVLSFGCYKALRFIFQVHITIHPAAKETFHLMVLKFQSETMWSEESHHTEVGVGSKDADLLPDPHSEDTKNVRSSRRISYAVRVAHLAKAKVGLLTNTKANELVYARLCRDEMIKHGLRPSHIAHSVPLAVAACFIPLDADFLAASIRNGVELKERVSLLGKPSSL